ncbi:hypothetical protein [Aquisalinus flavus]|uniref:Uncharacterized protein n=1 Tax=Aquisalinus flavus TaxID=1526572 RepID=A0A8J2Y885_9PROT|nr:hypothetical protein [Aquisalinus flavus]MBD0425486.1 hypothetical protein [Aquisalinus flavus]UNE48881.1 hypothetical protein FF099_12880 [Aquisalinus flavus]GGD15691.1 hypothetical protein GCM10011342_25570 [Aquisalinus flavus]
MRRFDWRRDIISIAAIILILFYVVFLVTDIATGKGLENLWFYVVMSLCLAMAIGAKIMPPDDRGKTDSRGKK